MAIHDGNMPGFEVTRRAGLAGMLAAVGLMGTPPPCEAAFGQAANIFGKPTNTAGFVPYAGEGYALLLPSKWNPSREKDFPGVELRYEDNQEPVTHLMVMKNPTDKSSITAFGGPDKFLDQYKFLLGEQVFKGETQSEGGFGKDKVSKAALLGMEQATDSKGKPYYKYELLTTAADGHEGGRHHLIAASVSGGNLYILKVQAGDKRWFKGAEKDAKGVWNSFIVA
jgi:hypothetical protein